MKSSYSLILAGGSSSRLFPFNKILSDLTDSGKTLIQQAYERASTLAPKEHRYVLAAADLASPIGRQLRLSKSHFFVDPMRRGTWPALMWAMAHLRQEDPEAILAVLTGDHVIPRLAAFKRAAMRACRLAAQKPAVVMLGVSPSDAAAAWTGFGVFRVRGETATNFAEKPALAQARHMIRQGGWHWNSGMFFFRISTAERVLARHQRAMFAQYEKLCAAVARRQARQARALYAEFPAKIPHPSEPARLVDNTIDFALMTPLVNETPSPLVGEGGDEGSSLRQEFVPSPKPSPTGGEGLKLQALAVTGGLPLWTDLGQWDAVSAVVKMKKGRNIQIGNVRADGETHDCILAADRGFTLEAKGLADAVAAVSERGLLVLPRRELSRIKEHVAQAPMKKFLIVNAFPRVRIQRHGRRVVVSGAAVIR